MNESIALDSSVVIAALDQSDPDHQTCRPLLTRGRPSMFAHALSEIFSVLTGGQLGRRLPADQVADLLTKFVVPCCLVTHLETRHLLRAYSEAKARGIRGGAVYDFLHLVAARESGSTKFYTLDTGDFKAMAREYDPEISRP